MGSLERELQSLKESNKKLRKQSTNDESEKLRSDKEIKKLKARISQLQKFFKQKNGDITEEKEAAESEVSELKKDFENLVASKIKTVSKLNEEIDNLQVKNNQPKKKGGLFS